MKKRLYPHNRSQDGVCACSEAWESSKQLFKSESEGEDRGVVVKANLRTESDNLVVLATLKPLSPPAPPRILGASDILSLSSNLSIQEENRGLVGGAGVMTEATLPCTSVEPSSSVLVSAPPASESIKCLDIFKAPSPMLASETGDGPFLSFSHSSTRDRRLHLIPSRNSASSVLWKKRDLTPTLSNHVSLCSTNVVLTIGISKKPPLSLNVCHIMQSLPNHAFALGTFFPLSQQQLSITF